MGKRSNTSCVTMTCSSRLTGKPRLTGNTPVELCDCCIDMVHAYRLDVDFDPYTTLLDAINATYVDDQGKPQKPIQAY